MPTISVITPNFNSGGKLSDTAKSVLAQNADCEYIIVDGASTDGCLDLAVELAAQNPETIRVFSAPDRGVYDAMNKGIGFARGRYLLFLGAGDQLMPGALREVAGALPEHDCGLVYGDVMTADGWRYDGAFGWRKLWERNLPHQATFYGRDLFPMVGGYRLEYRAYADWELNYRCFAQRRIVKKHLPVIVASYEGGGLSSRGDFDFSREKHRLYRHNFGWLRYVGVRLPAVRRRLIAPFGSFCSGFSERGTLQATERGK